MALPASYTAFITYIPSGEGAGQLLLSCLNLRATQGRHCYYSHYKDEETETQKGDLTCPKTQSGRGGIQTKSYAKSRCFCYWTTAKQIITGVTVGLGTCAGAKFMGCFFLLTSQMERLALTQSYTLTNIHKVVCENTWIILQVPVLYLTLGLLLDLQFISSRT